MEMYLYYFASILPMSPEVDAVMAVWHMLGMSNNKPESQLVPMFLSPRARGTAVYGGLLLVNVAFDATLRLQTDK